MLHSKGCHSWQTTSFIIRFALFLYNLKALAFLPYFRIILSVHIVIVYEFFRIDFYEPKSITDIRIRQDYRATGSYGYLRVRKTPLPRIAAKHGCFSYCHHAGRDRRCLNPHLSQKCHFLLRNHRYHRHCQAIGNRRNLECQGIVIRLCHVRSCQKCQAVRRSKP